MKNILLGAVAALTVASAHAESVRHQSILARLPFSTLAAGAPEASVPSRTGSSSASLDALFREWDRAGFSPPMKPLQFRVYGRDGRVTSGSGYNAMVSLIRAAARNAREGRDQRALAEIASARRLLDR